jgi:hypothetical protein
MIQAQTLELLEAHCPDDQVIDGGSAKCKEMDKIALETYVNAYGRPQGGVNFLEADWVATDNALYYITPRAGWNWSSKWDEIASVALGKKSLLMPTQRVHVSARYPGQVPPVQTHDWQLSKTAAQLLVNIAAQRIR